MCGHGVCVQTFAMVGRAMVMTMMGLGTLRLEWPAL
jgi:hypothetical protein